MSRFFLTLVFFVACAVLQQVFGCTNIIVSPTASSDSSVIVAYNSDSAELYGALYHYPAADHPEGSVRNVYDWGSGRYLGHIPEVPHTYNVVGNINEHGLIIAETTLGGREILQSQDKGILDYGSLIWITLQRAKTATEAITTIDSLMQQYGYYSSGESFYIADNYDAWIMEINGKGNFELGAVWVARKVPDGHICAHANQARITTFPLNDPESTLYSPDVISFARKIGLYPVDKPDAEFSFRDAYDPLTFSGARACEARVWSIFSQIMGEEWSNRYVDYALGYNLTNSMPLFVQPPKGKKISVMDTMQYFRSHYEGTQLDTTGRQFSDVGAYTYSPYRTHPLGWTSYVAPDGSESDKPIRYTHERPIATPQTGWNFVAQSRRFMPRELSGLLWFGVDDSSTTVRFPIYGSATKVPEAYSGIDSQDGMVASMMVFSFDSAFYVFNLMANWVYSRWDLMYPDVLKVILAKETQFMEEIKSIDQKALSIYEEESPSKAIEFVTNYSVETGNKLVKDWLKLFGEMFVKYRDGYVITADPADTSCGCHVENANYPQPWYDRIVRDTKSHYQVMPGVVGVEDKKNLKVVDKNNLKALK